MALGVAEQRLGALAIERDQPIGRRRPRVDADHAHAVGMRGAAQRPREGHEARVAGAAGDVRGVELLARRADDVDDHAALSLLHPGIGEAGQVDVAEDLQLPRPAPGLLVDLEEVAAGDRAGVVDQDVELARPLRERLGGAALRKVGRFRVRTGQGISRGDLDPGALGGERLGASAADAFRAAGHQHALPREV